jgi:hypothetical protein
VRSGHAYSDSYCADIDASVACADFVYAFYSSGLFKIERTLLRLFLSKASSDSAARRLADGGIDTFAAWRVEARTARQLLMCDYSGRTRSWFMVDALSVDGRSSTRLYFGSAVVPVVNRNTKRAQLGCAFHLLLGFHKLYSRALLRTARSRLISMR